MKKLLLFFCAVVGSHLLNAQCSIDTIPDAFNNGGQCYIDNLAINSTAISTSSGFQLTGVSYQSFPAPYIMLRQGEQAWVDIGYNNSNNVAICMWIDYDNNGFYSSTEIVLYDPNVSSSFYQAPIIVPFTVLPDTVHVRLTIQQNTSGWGPGVNDACEAPGVGETEDYMAIIECAYPQPISFDPYPTECQRDSILLSAFAMSDVAWYTGSPLTLQNTGTTFYLHTTPATLDTVVYLQSVSAGCYTAPMDSMVITLLPSPVANILGPDTVRSCSAVTISATPGPYTFSWNSGDTGSVINITNGFGGDLNLSVTAPNGCSSFDDIYVNIATQSPANYANIIPGSWYCTNLEVYMNYDSIIAPGTCSWYTYPSNVFIGSGSQVIYTLPDTGVFQYMAVVNSVCGIDTIIRTVSGYYGVSYDSVYVVDGTQDINGTYVICYNNSGTITAIAAGVNGTVEEWILTDVTVGFSMTWNDDDTLVLSSGMAQVGHLYSAQAVMLSPQGCYDTTAAVFLTPANTMNFNLSDTVWACSFPAVVGYGSVNYGVYDLLWGTGDTTNFITVNAPTQVTIYTVDNNTGCTMHDTAYVGDASSIAALLTDTTYACQGVAYFDASMVSYSVDYWIEYDQNWNQQSMSSGSDYYVYDNGSPVYLVFAGLNDRGCYIFDTTLVLFNGTFTFSLGPDITTAVTPVTLSGPAGYYSYNWSPVSGNGPSVQVNTSGTYSLTIDNGQGCVYTDTIVVNILPMGMSEITSAVVNVFPNPANDAVTVTSSDVITGIMIYDTEGSLMRSEQVAEQRTAEVYVGDLAAGFYFMEVVTSSGVQRMKLAIAR